MSTHSFRYHPVLGTELHVILDCETAEQAEAAQARALEEILRLEALLSTYRSDTPLAQWLRSETEELPAEAVSVLALAQSWFVVSDGALHPGLGRLRARWREAERSGDVPSPTECRQLAEEARILPFVLDSLGRVTRRDRCDHLDLDAYAKGWIVDRAAEAGRGEGVASVLINIGGDMRLVGSGPVSVAIQDPSSRVDNAPHLGVVRLTDGGLASSGAARRGFSVGGRWYGHVLDPVSGWPVGKTVGVTVVGPDAVTADTLATVVQVRGLGREVDNLLDSYEAAALTVDAAGAVRTSRGWRDRVDADLRVRG